MHWTVIEYQQKTRDEVLERLGQHGIPVVSPMVQEYVVKAQKKVWRPALEGKLFVPADENLVLYAFDRVPQLEKAWRDTNYHLLVFPQSELDAFLAALKTRQKKAIKNKAMNLADMAETDWYKITVRLHGQAEAIKRFGHEIAREVA